MADWFRLDNAAKIYPAISNKRRGSMYRVSATMHDLICPDDLQGALDITVKRFPSIAVKLHKGLFWYYFENAQTAPRIQEERPVLCLPIDRNADGGFLFRVTYYQRRINVEMFHSLTDGYGAIAFLKALVLQYLRLQGHEISTDGEVLDDSIPFSNEEVEDSFLSHYDPKAGHRIQESLAYQLQGTPPEDGRLRLISVKTSVEEVLALCRAKGFSMTEYMVALLGYSIYQAQISGRPNRYRLPVKISVPVNLRRFFRSRTLRNFSSYVIVKFDLEENTPFDDVLKSVREQMKQGITRENLAKEINANIQAERNFILRLTPLFIKNLALRVAYRMYGERVFTCAFSNLGAMTLPEGMANAVADVDVTLGLGDINRINVTACSYGDVFHMNFTRSIIEPEVERIFCRHLAGEGLNVTVHTNDGR